MYGLINKSFREFVIDSYGEECWSSIHSVTSLDEECFLAMRRQSDDSTFLLVKATAENLDVPGEVILEQYGRFWVDSVARLQFGQIMKATGLEFIEFVNNLDDMHKGISSSFLGYSPPSFFLSECDGGYYRLDYSSARCGLTPFVSGLLQGLGQYFATDVDVKSIKTAQSDAGERSTFLLEIKSRT